MMVQRRAGGAMRVLFESEREREALLRREVATDEFVFSLCKHSRFGEMSSILGAIEGLARAKRGGWGLREWQRLRGHLLREAFEYEYVWLVRILMGMGADVSAMRRRIEANPLLVSSEMRELLEGEALVRRSALLALCRE